MQEFILKEPERFLIDDFFSKIDIKKFFDNDTKKIKNQKIFLCPVNALAIDEDKVYKSDNCIQCNLCELKYKSDQNRNKKTDLPVVSEYFLTDIKRLSVALKYLFPNGLVACEVKTEGNYRNKRIDIVYSEKDSIYLVKVLTDIQSYAFYKRSYDEILKNIKDKYKNSNVKVKILTTADIKNSKDAEYDHLYSIEDFFKKEE